MVIKGLVLAFQWATTLPPLNVKGDPTELREEAIWQGPTLKFVIPTTMINTLKKMNKLNFLVRH